MIWDAQPAKAQAGAGVGPEGHIAELYVCSHTIHPCPDISLRNVSGPMQSLSWNRARRCWHLLASRRRPACPKHRPCVGLLQLLDLVAGVGPQAHIMGVRTEFFYTQATFHLGSIHNIDEALPSQEWPQRTPSALHLSTAIPRPLPVISSVRSAPTAESPVHKAPTSFQWLPLAHAWFPRPQLTFALGCLSSWLQCFVQTKK